MSAPAAAEIVSLWCEAIQCVLRKRRIYAAEGAIRAALGKGLAPVEILREFEAYQPVVAGVLSRALRVWDSWVRR